MAVFPKKKKSTINMLKKMRHTLWLLAAGCLLLSVQSAPPRNPRVEALLKKMTLEEKIGQLTLYTTDWESTGPTIREGYKTDIRNGTCGALFNSHTVKFTRELQRIAVEESRLKIPLLFGYDVIHGYKTIFPIPLAEACSFDLEAIERAARVAGAESAAAGLHWTFAPMVDIARDPRWGRVMEGAGEDTYLGCRVAEARVKGFQGKGLGNTDAVMACVKHFAGYGAPIAGKDYNSVDMSEMYFREYYLPPYKAAIDAGAATVMTSFNDYNSVPATGNRYLLTDILRKEWGFGGFIVTDYTSINEMVNHGVAADDKAAGEMAIRAGVDMDLQGGIFQKHLAQSVKEGKVSIALIDEAVRRILELKFKMGLFDNPYKFCDETREKQTILSADNRQSARDVARKSIVLLKNDKNILPLAPGTRVALVGPLIDTKQDLIGNWCAAGSGDDCVTVKDGLRNAGFQVVAEARACETEGDDRSRFNTALEAAAKADVVVAVVGERAWMSGEAASRSDIGLPGPQEALIHALAGAGKPLVVVLMNGRPLAIPEVSADAGALVEAWWLGTETGNALADVLSGKYNPSGKLAMSFPRSEGQIPVFYNHKNTGRPFDPNSKWTSKYIDAPNTPLFPFGYGLSYTTFEYSQLASDKPVYRKGNIVRVSVQVRNTGQYDGEETVQLYLHDKVASVTRPVKELKGFKKVFLKKGESKTVAFELRDADFRFYNQQLRFQSEKGDFDVLVGSHSEDLQKITITLN
jgi:beta-glucosidase